METALLEVRLLLPWRDVSNNEEGLKDDDRYGMCAMEGRNAEARGEGMVISAEVIGWNLIGEQEYVHLNSQWHLQVCNQSGTFAPNIFFLCALVSQECQWCWPRKNWEGFFFLFHLECSDTVCDLVPFMCLSTFFTSEALDYSIQTYFNDFLIK